MESTSRITETVSLEKREMQSTSIDGGKAVLATVTRIFSHGNKPVGKLIQFTVCKDCYLEEMAAGDFLPVVTKGGSTEQTFRLLNEDKTETFWGSVSYSEARKVSERQTTFLGRLRNKVALVYMTYTAAGF